MASKDLEEGEEIFIETPFVVGPKAFTYPLCLGCYSAWPRLPDTHTLCSKCSWPVCDSECENNPHHKDYECQVCITMKFFFNLHKILILIFCFFELFFRFFQLLR